jgi:mannose-6-phosphate isomerase-like protein (cupin superfamily)
MKNIRILYNNIDVKTILEEIITDHWAVNTSRQRLKEHVHTETISLVQGYETVPDPKSKYKDARNSHAYRPTSLYEHYPETLKTLKTFFPVGLSRIAIIKLKAGKRVFPHFDHGRYYEARNRYHLVVTGSYEYTVGDETEQILPGMLFWFDNQQTHSAFNNSEEDRISVIFDVEK